MNMETGETKSSEMKRRRLDVVGENMKDPFFDSYQEEADTCCDIMELIDSCPFSLISLTFGKDFLKKIVRSHILHIREIEKDLTGRKYAE